MIYVIKILCALFKLPNFQRMSITPKVGTVSYGIEYLFKFFTCLEGIYSLEYNIQIKCYGVNSFMIFVCLAFDNELAAL